MASNKWVLLSAFQKQYKSAILATSLESKQIAYKMVDKVDSAFNFVGEVEIYVKQSDYVTALRVKEKLEL